MSLDVLLGYPCNIVYFFFQAEDGIRDSSVTGVQTCALPISLPPLILHSLFARNAKALGHWLAVRPQNCVTVLDTHDGIGVIDVGAGGNGESGLLAPGEIDQLVETIHSRSNGESWKATGAAARYICSGGSRQKCIALVSSSNYFTIL